MLLRLSIIGLVLLFIVTCALTSCSPFYVIQAAYVESGILMRRKDIPKVIADGSTTEVERHKLELVTQAREYAISIGLTPGKSFTKYTRVDEDVLAWVLMASRRDAFELKTWWFPFVGSVPYKGYFDKADAESEGKRLEEKGYEQYIRGTDAFSTLGWFNDPVLSTILKNPDVRIVNTIIHESFHATVWIPNNVDFNESLANYVGVQGAWTFYDERQAKCGPACPDATVNEAKVAAEEFNRELEFATVVKRLYDALQEVYQSSSTTEEKLTKRVEVFEKEMVPLRARYPNMKIFKQINNAEIMQLRIYLTDLQLFRDLFEKVGKDWTRFIAEMKDIKASVAKDSSKKPFDILKQKLL